MAYMTNPLSAEYHGRETTAHAGDASEIIWHPLNHLQTVWLQVE